jgi:surfactin synthase thioesterase subunit
MSEAWFGPASPESGGARAPFSASRTPAARLRPTTAGAPPLPEVEVIAVQAPGREGRMKEAPIVDSRELVARLTDAIAPRLRPPRVFLRPQHGRASSPMRWRASCCAARRPCPRTFYVPAAARRRCPNPARCCHRLPDGEFVEELNRRFGGLPAAIVEEPELLELFLPVLRADVTLLETHVFTAETPLDVPMSA